MHQAAGGSPSCARRNQGAPGGPGGLWPQQPFLGAGLQVTEVPLTRLMLFKGPQAAPWFVKTGPLSLGLQLGPLLGGELLMLSQGHAKGQTCAELWGNFPRTNRFSWKLHGGGSFLPVAIQPLGVPLFARERLMLGAGQPPKCVEGSLAGTGAAPATSPPAARPSLLRLSPPHPALPLWLQTLEGGLTKGRLVLESGGDVRLCFCCWS